MMMAAVSIIEVLETHYKCKAAPKLKWVNDVFFGNGKVSGILTKGTSQGRKFIVSLGIGVNLNIAPDLGSSDKNKPTSVKQEMCLQEDIDVDLFVNRLSESLFKNLQILEKEGFEHGLK